MAQALADLAEWAGAVRQPLRMPATGLEQPDADYDASRMAADVIVPDDGCPCGCGIRRRR